MTRRRKTGATPAESPVITDEEYTFISEEEKHVVEEEEHVSSEEVSKSPHEEGKPLPKIREKLDLRPKTRRHRNQPRFT
jgi:hypothetical protein